MDNTPRWIKVLDALSQLGNVLFLPRHKDTTANESISGRSHREGWKTLEATINLIFFWDPDHCRKAVERDAARAKEYLLKIRE